MGGFPFAEYYAAERSAGVVAALIGVASAAGAAWLIWARGPLVAMAWPLAVAALLGLGIGTGMAVRAQRELRKPHTVPIATLEAQVKAYQMATRVELGVIALAAVLSLWFSRPGTARALLLGILVEAAAFVCFDTFGLTRATRGLEQLRTNVAVVTLAS